MKNRIDFRKTEETGVDPRLGVRITGFAQIFASKI